MIYKLGLMCFAFLANCNYANKTVGDACIDQLTQTEGSCVILEECDSAKTDLQKYPTRPTQCGYFANSLLVCCRDSPTTTRPTTSPKRTDRKPGDISNKKCQEFGNVVTETVYAIPLKEKPEKQEYSGVRCTIRGSELIIGGVKAKQGEFPHMAAIGWKVDGKYRFECGGTLIDKRFVLTAGHCTTLPGETNNTPEIVRLGDQNLDPDEYDGADDIEIGIRKIHYHPEYKHSRKYHDIALLELDSDVNFKDGIRPACLWTNEDFGNHEKAWATGWGIVDSETSEKSNELLKVLLTIMDISECNKTLADVINRKWPHGFDKKQMCAGDKRLSKDTCQGDSGSPLQIISDENKCLYKVLGITSFGAKYCGHAPAVYTRVSSYIDWIEKIAWPDE